eukprot:10149185-Alexandrium_andersonii.AAC.1
MQGEPGRRHSLPRESKGGPCAICAAEGTEPSPAVAGRPRVVLCSVECRPNQHALHATTSAQ